ncbi:MAG: polyisoprenyl-teichoic acid--peptidoglycan teichoic acid transferase [Solirubrobacteraceae bacterium]|nr:polyisoprenyl-teichoic acid--peptidoglycan teichoic acid transferase [Solirubrobacteraceae bacterium]
MSVLPVDDTPRLGRRMAKRFAAGGVLIVLLTAIAVASALLLEVHADVNAFTNGSSPIPGIKDVLPDVAAGSPQTILLLGSDRRYADGKGNPPRSDTIILVRLDPDKKATAIMSIPRDLKVDVPGHGIQKLNGAYHDGGPKLAVRTIHDLLGVDINHVVNINFGGFARAVNRLGCVYADVDRRYFNDNTGPEPDYAVIDLKPGYQKLCGQDALSYVRYRHEDSDFVRAKRQQEFLGQAKEQIGLGKLFGDRRELLRIFGRYTQTDIADSNDAAILRLLKLAYESSKTPLAEIQFPANDAPGGYVEISPAALAQTVQRFVEVRGSSPTGGGPPKRKRIKRSTGLAPGLVLRRDAGETHVIDISANLPTLPVYFPAAIVATGGYVGSPRSYDIFDRGRHKYRAYRIVLSEGESGEYYGVQGTTWKAPPILDNPTDEVRMRNRTYQRYFDGSRIRLIAWRTPKAAYWVSNTLSQKLTNKQMMDIARSLQRIGQP